ncbi:MAG: globin domain-containing protein [Bacteroidota bacterium]
MTQQEIRLVQESVEKILPQTREMGDLLYQRLFEIAPEVKSLFKTDIATQSRKLMSILVHIIANLDQLDKLSEEFKDLASKHHDYQITPEHYRFLKSAFLWTLEQKLSNWSIDLENAWRVAYDTLVGAMITQQEAMAQQK